MRKIAAHPLLVRRLYSDDQVSDIARKAFAHGLFGGAATVRTPGPSVHPTLSSLALMP